MPVHICQGVDKEAHILNRIIFKIPGTIQKSIINSPLDSTYRLVLVHLRLPSSGRKLTAIPPFHGFPASLQIPQSAELGNSHGGFFLRLKGWHTWGYKPTIGGYRLIPFITGRGPPCRWWFQKIKENTSNVGEIDPQFGGAYFFQDGLSPPKKSTNNFHLGKILTIVPGAWKIP